MPGKKRRPDVQIKQVTSTIRLPGDDKPKVSHQATCRYCPESFSAGNVALTEEWADEHVRQQAHKDTKTQRIKSGLGQRELDE